MAPSIHSVVALGVLAGRALAVNNGLARTPQMGWNNWNALGCDVSESLLLDTSLILVDSGLRDVGYNYVVLDDCWSERRGEDGFLIVDKEKFPSGMNHISDELHRQNLLYGMYSSAGEMTCARYAGSLDYEVQDAKSFAGWGVDYLKYDNCYHMGRFGTPLVSFNRYKEMWDALNSTGRPILYSLCSWGEDYVHTWGMSIANSWRMSGDIYDSFTRPDDLCACTDAANPLCTAPGTHCSVLNIINKVAPYVDRGQFGGWNDLDMLEVGNGGMTDDEYKAHFALWAALKSPLLMGNDLRDLSPSALTILNNPAIIAINQDPEGRSVNRIIRDLNVKKDKYGIGEVQVWSGSLYGGDQVVLLVNAADEDLEISASLEDIFLHDGPGGSAPQVQEKWEVYDLWANRMDEDLAKKVLDADTAKALELLASANWYNSTALPYKEGLKKRDARLMGKKVGKIDAGGKLTKKVKKHAAEIFRLKSAGPGGKRKVHSKDDLSRRRKCATPQFGSACSYCTDRGIHCTRDTQAASRHLRIPSNGVPKHIASTATVVSVSEPALLSPQFAGATPQPNGLPPKEICLELVRLYFDYIHDQFHSLFHPPSILEDVESGVASPIIVFAMMALSARFSSNPIFAGKPLRARGDYYAAQSTQLLDLRDISLTTIQACVLLGAFSITNGEAAAESVYYCAGCRIANLMDLAHMHTSDGLDQEVNRRVWWSLCMIDVWSSTGVNLPRQMPSLEDLPLPMDDIIFLRLRRGDFLHNSFNQTPGLASLLSQMITLNRILHQINTLNIQTATSPLPPQELASRITSLSSALTNWHASLPTTMHDTPSNLSYWASRGLGRMFVAVYLGYYHFGQLLFYQFLHGDTSSEINTISSPGSAHTYAQECKAYAQSLCEIVYASYEIPNCDVQYNMVGHILVIASTIQIHTLLFSDNDVQITAARGRLERNFEILMRLRDYWPTLDASFTRLRAFHKACRDSMDESFRLDLWMLRFLSEFAEPVDDRVVGASPDQRIWSWENIGASPT